MKVQCKNIMLYMEQLAPASLAEDWDNVGLILGSGEKEIKRILLCLDVTSEVVEEALSSDVDLVISHHPIIFKKIGRINESEYKGSLLYKLIKADISVFCAHTNLDVVEGGVNRKLAEKLELNDIIGLKNPMLPIDSTESIKKEGKTVRSPFIYGLGAVGNLKQGLSIKEFITFVKEKLDVENVRMVGHDDKTVKKIAVFCGSFDDDLKPILAHGADILVTGDLKYHTAVDALGMGMCIIDAGHFNTEKIILPVLKEVLASEFPDIDVICSKMVSDPFKTY